MGMQVAILAGGLATRLRPLTETMPKSMVRVAGRPFLEHQLELLAEQGVRDVVLCVGHLGEQIREHFGDGSAFGVRIRYSEEGDCLLGTAGALRRAEPLFDDRFFVLYGDSYLCLDYRDVMTRFEASDRLGLMVVYRNDDRWDRSNVVVESGLVRVYDKRERRPGMVYIDYGVSALRREALVAIPTDRAVSLEALYQDLIGRGELLAHEATRRFYEIGSFAGLAELEELLSVGGVA